MIAEIFTSVGNISVYESNLLGQVFLNSMFYKSSNLSQWKSKFHVPAVSRGKPEA